MKVYIIHEDNHGVIGVADSYESAVQFLLTEWMTGNFEIWDREKRKYNTLVINPEKIKAWGRDKFNDFFEDIFWIEKTDLITDARNKIEEVLTDDGLELRL